MMNICVCIIIHINEVKPRSSRLIDLAYLRSKGDKCHVQMYVRVCACVYIRADKRGIEAKIWKPNSCLVPDACSVSGSGCGVISSRVRELRLVRVDHYLTERRPRRRRDEREDVGLLASVRFSTPPASWILKNIIPISLPCQGKPSPCP